jgi:hypothetical protein
MAEVTELRCSAGQLLAKLVQEGGSPAFVQPNNVIELACRKCKEDRNRGRRPGDPRVQHVLHRYDFAGELVETLVVEE